MDDKILFWINDEELDNLLHEHFSPGYDGDYYTLSELDWEKFQDLAISSGYDFDEDFGEAVKMESRKIYRIKLTELRKLIGEQTEMWWKALFGFGRIFFTASSNSHAYSKAIKWSKKVGFGKPDVIKKVEKPHDFDNGFKYDEECDVYVEQ
jgi:hypothetical protein